jgi:uncharacterized protein YggE
LLAQVWDKAIADARQRAEKTLKATGMKIDSVYAISPVSFPRIEQEIFGELGATAGYSVGGAKPDPKQYRLPSITVSESIHVIYLISPADGRY